jgi:pyridinium-3,5-bisthiocarboxylic acid mononucleotide nickel chelatase
MKIAYVDCFSGISGDMFLASLLDAGLPLEVLNNEINKLNLEEKIELQTQTTRKGALRALALDVKVPHSHHHRHLSDILEIIHSSQLDEAVKKTAGTIFTLLAQAEARVHGEPVEHIHFHEVGALDSILDIVGASFGLHYLGIERLYASALPVGSGQIQSQHGLLPLPAPATLELMRLGKIPLVPSPAEVELVTPTGAAILASLATFERPHMVMTALGIGAGQRDLPWANILRLMIGETPAGMEQGMVQIETNIDDMNPQMFGNIMERLFKAGAMDVYMVPVYMKKNRPATLLGVIARRQDEAAIADLILRETTTLGMRVLPIYRYEAQRQFQKVNTPYGEATLKIKLLDGRPIQAMPEYDECQRLAAEHQVSLAEVYAAILAAGNGWLRNAQQEA